LRLFAVETLLSTFPLLFSCSFMMRLQKVDK